MKVFCLHLLVTVTTRSTGTGP